MSRRRSVPGASASSSSARVSDVGRGAVEPPRATRRRVVGACICLARLFRRAGNASPVGFEPARRGVDRAVSAAAKDRRDSPPTPPPPPRATRRNASPRRTAKAKATAATDASPSPRHRQAHPGEAPPPRTVRAEAERPFRRTIRREAGDAPAGGRDRDAASGARGSGSRPGSTREPRASSETAQYSSTTTPSPSFPARGAARRKEPAAVGG